MYKTIVTRQIRRAFAQLNQGDHRALLSQLAPDASYEFAGRHALGGRRTGRDLIGNWFGRVYRILPDLHFEPRDVLVKGAPWATRVVTIVDVTGTVAGAPYTNRMMQIVDLRWARIHSIYTLEDTQYLAETLDRLAAGGLTEAAAAPITG